jgi:hypothetical protein
MLTSFEDSFTSVDSEEDGGGGEGEVGKEEVSLTLIVDSESSSSPLVPASQALVRGEGSFAMREMEEGRATSPEVEIVDTRARGTAGSPMVEEPESASTSVKNDGEGAEENVSSASSVAQPVRLVSFLPSLASS